MLTRRTALASLAALAAPVAPALAAPKPSPRFLIFEDRVGGGSPAGRIRAGNSLTYFRVGPSPDHAGSETWQIKAWMEVGSAKMHIVEGSPEEWCGGGGIRTVDTRRTLRSTAPLASS